MCSVCTMQWLYEQFNNLNKTYFESCQFSTHYFQRSRCINFVGKSKSYVENCRCSEKLFQPVHVQLYTVVCQYYLYKKNSTELGKNRRITGFRDKMLLSRIKGLDNTIILLENEQPVNLCYSKIDGMWT